MQQIKFLNSIIELICEFILTGRKTTLKNSSDKK